MNRRPYARNRRGAVKRFRPLMLPSLVLWLRGDSYVPGTWTDKSTAGNNFTQGTGGLQPSLIASGVNGLPSVRGDGISQILNSSFTIAQPSTFFLVYKSIVIGANGVHDVIFANAAITGYLSDSTPQYYAYAGGSGLATAGSAANGVFNCVSGTYNGVSSILRRSFAQVKAGDAGASSLSNPSLFGAAGGSRWSNCEIAELIFYSSVLTASEILTVEAYLKSRYAL